MNEYKDPVVTLVEEAFAELTNHVNETLTAMAGDCVAAVLKRMVEANPAVLTVREPFTPEQEAAFREAMKNNPLHFVTYDEMQNAPGVKGQHAVIEPLAQQVPFEDALREQEAAFRAAMSDPTRRDTVMALEPQIIYPHVILGMVDDDDIRKAELAARARAIEEFKRLNGDAGSVDLLTVDGCRKYTWDEIVAMVGEVQGARPWIDPSYSVGHQMTGINFNSLSRIIDKVQADTIRAVGQPVAATLESTEPANVKELREASQHIVEILQHPTRSVNIFDQEKLEKALAGMEKPECKCTLRGTCVGDGCEVCNPEYAAQFDAKEE